MVKYPSIRLSVCSLTLAAVSAFAGPAEEAYREARAHLSARRFAEASACFEAATVATDTSVAAAAWFGRGEALYGTGQWRAAADAYDTVIRRYPDSFLVPQALYARGHAEHRSGRLAQALDTLSAFKKNYPTNALTPTCILSIESITRLLETQARQKAIAEVTRELAAINAAVRAEEFDEASIAAERFLKAHPESPQAAELRFLIATCAYRNKAYDRAAEKYQAFLDHHPQQVRSNEARRLMADSLFRAGRYEEARLLFEKIAQETDDPQEEARVTIAIGDCQAARQNWDEAERTYLNVEVLLNCDALRPVALKRLADLYEKRGQPDRARRTREDLRRRYPSQE